MKYIFKILLSSAMLTAFGASLLQAGETNSQAAVRAQMSNFWRVAEARVAVTPDSTPANRAQPVLRELRTTAAPCRPVIVQSSPPPTVEAIQSVQRDSDSGHFGLSLFGGVRLFDFTWGDEQTSETDSLHGRL